MMGGKMPGPLQMQKMGEEIQQFIKELRDHMERQTRMLEELVKQNEHV